MASLRALGWPSCSTLWMVMRALKVWTSSAMMGCLDSVTSAMSPASWETSLPIYLHLHARPKGQRGLVVPCIDNACSDMLALGGDFVAVGCLFDAYGQLLIGPAWQSVTIGRRRRRRRRWAARKLSISQSTYLVCSLVRRLAAMVSMRTVPSRSSDRGVVYSRSVGRKTTVAGGMAIKTRRFQ